MKERYKLLKDLPTHKAGEKFFISKTGNLCTIKEPCHVLYFSKELEENPSILDEWFEKIPERPRTVWDLKEGDECYEIQLSYNGAVAVKRHWSMYLTHERSLGIITLTKDECENKIRYLLAKQILLRDTKGFKPDWSNYRQNKYYVYKPVGFEGLRAINLNSTVEGHIYFATREDAEASIKNHEKEWKTYLGVEYQ